MPFAFASFLGREQLSRCCTEKSPGVDGIPIEAFKIIRESDVLFGEFTKFLHACWRDQNVDPEAFHTTLVTVLPKKGGLSDPNKWRRTSLLSVGSKLVSSVIATVNPTPPCPAVFTIEILHLCC